VKKPRSKLAKAEGEEWKANVTPEFLRSKLLSAISGILTAPNPESPVAALNKHKPSPGFIDALFRCGLNVKATGLDTQLAGRLSQIWESRLHRERVAVEGWQVSTQNGSALAANNALELSILTLQALASWEPEVFERIGFIMRQLAEKISIPRWGAVAREVLDAMNRDGVDLTKSQLAYYTKRRMVDRVGREVEEPVWHRVWKAAGCEDLKAGKSGPSKGSGGRPRKDHKEGKSSVTRKR